MEWDIVIGIEVHVQLCTQSKLFSATATKAGAAPNSQASAICLGMPGMLPMLNQDAVDKAILFAASIGAKVDQNCHFDRKQYFYPDLPKGYQISQHTNPIVGEGELPINIGDTTKIIRIERAHLEEDAGKSVHDQFPGASGIDLNRAGIPLLEIVSKPDMTSAEEAVQYLKTLHALVKCLGICDGNMQEGSFRADCNVSIKPKGSNTLGTRTETKNLNSFRFVEKAIAYEVARQIKVIESGEEVQQETRLFNPDTGKTRTMRSKEDANDYRYFPDPDLLPLAISDEHIARIQATMPELPWQKQSRFESDYHLSAYDAAVLVSSQSISDYFEAVIAHKVNAKIACNWITSELLGVLNQKEIRIEDSPVNANGLAGLILRIEDETISGKLAKQVFELMFSSGKDADSIIEEKGLKQITSEDEILKIVQSVLDQFPEQVAQYQSGQEKLLGFFVGQVMKATQGKANPGQVNQLVKSQLQSKTD